ncbi:OmpA family protein [Ramlibacter sp. 2FC]|uniref:OmpA family protein n=1 Tax=Ramlibacter sp. 2FC TaxID=2502188 RepID=UPI0010F86BD2|nr:OmpA family protein [Ramlibacter sp. 2FC]
MKSITRTTLLLAAALVAASAGHAHDRHLHDRSGSAVRSADGACWRTGVWRDAPDHPAHPECDPQPEVFTQAAEPVIVLVVPVETQPVAEPLPQPVLVIERVVVETDALFDFGRTELRARGRQRLDQLAAHLTQARQVDWVRVVGHADRLGTSHYNQALSEGRAQAVADHLVAQGVDAALIRAEGRGESEPVTAAAACTGAAGAALVACLQPDRRVDVDAAIGMPREAGGL